MSWAVVVVAASTALTAYSQIEQGRYANKQAKADAEAQQGQSRLEAERMLEESKRIRSAAQAQAADNGLNVGIGSPVKIDEQIAYDANQDAWMTRITGDSRARGMEIQGKNARNDGYMQAASTALNSASSYYGKSGGKK